MSFFSRWFETTPDVGESLEGPRYRVDIPYGDTAPFFRALDILFDDKCTMVFEGTTEPAFAEVLSRVAISPTFKVARGTIWPKSDFYHVPVQFAQQAADAIDKYGVSLPSIHFYVHDGQRVLLEWYDAFTRDPAYLSKDVAVESAHLFAQSLGATLTEAELE